MISIVITAFKEQETIGKCVESIISQKFSENYELVVSAPDKETQNVVRGYMKKNRRIKIFKDPGKGKSYALNLLIRKLKGRLIILTDGDVYLSKNSVSEIIREFRSRKNVGCVTGRPVPQEDKSTKYGYWANFLFDSAHKLRLRLRRENKFLECSGYLWGFKNGVIKDFPLDVAEDTIIPNLFHMKGFKIGYAPKAEVYVKNVDNWDDWIKQKLRTAKGHETLSKYLNSEKTEKTKSFANEASGVTSLVITYPHNLKEFFWSLQLGVARLYMWTKLFYETKIKKKKYSDGWERVESTK